MIDETLEDLTFEQIQICFDASDAVFENMFVRESEVHTWLKDNVKEATAVKPMGSRMQHIKHQRHGFDVALQPALLECVFVTGLSNKVAGEGASTDVSFLYLNLSGVVFDNLINVLDLLSQFQERTNWGAVLLHEGLHTPYHNVKTAIKYLWHHRKATYDRTLLSLY